MRTQARRRADRGRPAEYSSATRDCRAAADRGPRAGARTERDLRAAHPPAGSAGRADLARDLPDAARPDRAAARRDAEPSADQRALRRRDRGVSRRAHGRSPEPRRARAAGRPAQPTAAVPAGRRPGRPPARRRGDGGVPIACPGLSRAGRAAQQPRGGTRPPGRVGRGAPGPGAVDPRGAELCARAREPRRRPSAACSPRLRTGGTARSRSPSARGKLALSRELIGRLQPATESSNPRPGANTQAKPQ